MVKVDTDFNGAVSVGGGGGGGVVAPFPESFLQAVAADSTNTVSNTFVFIHTSLFILMESLQFSSVLILKTWSLIKISQYVLFYNIFGLEPDQKAWKIAKPEQYEMR